MLLLFEASDDGEHRELYWPSRSLKEPLHLRRVRRWDVLLGSANQYLRHRKYHKVTVIINKWSRSGSRHLLIRFVLRFSGTNLKQKELWRRGMAKKKKDLAGTITGEGTVQKHQASKSAQGFEIPLNWVVTQLSEEVKTAVPQNTAKCSHHRNGHIQKLL